MENARSFLSNRSSNCFDNLIVDVKHIYESFPVTQKMNPRPGFVELSSSPFHKRVYANRLIPLKLRRQFWKFFRQTYCDLTWFDEFKSYWTSVLGGRPLWGVQDFYFLKNLYRMKFQDNQIPDTDDPYVHLEAWQRPELLYQLLHIVYKQSFMNQTKHIVRLKRYKPGKIRAILEFGCGTAPIIESLVEFFPHYAKSVKMYMADIQTLAFHYAAYKFRKCSNAMPILLTPEEEFQIRIQEKVDCIFCMTVFEHLNHPLETAKIFYELLNQNGLLFFDYIKSEGDGLDTQAGVRERNDVLDFIETHFHVVHGHLHKDKSIGTTVVRKKA